MIKYSIPKNWMNYDLAPLIPLLTEAKAAVLSLINMPYQKSWVEPLQKMQLKIEVAGTSKIEGADFAGTELETAISETAEQLNTRSQRQARAAMLTYRWIATLPKDYPVNGQLIKNIHNHIVKDADDDHCEPGRIRHFQNVIFGIPPHRGAEGGTECEEAFKLLEHAVSREFKGHDQLIQALALHFHFAVMHPFEDGNGRTARALEALMLQRSGLTDHLFIAMSNYYYEEKSTYLATLSAVSPPEYDLTPFLAFGLKGIKEQCDRLFNQIKIHVRQSIFRNTMHDFFDMADLKPAVKSRQKKLLKLFLRESKMTFAEIGKQVKDEYSDMSAGNKALLRDLQYLEEIGAIDRRSEGENPRFEINLKWPETVTETGIQRDKFAVTTFGSGVVTSATSAASVTTTQSSLTSG